MVSLKSISLSSVLLLGIALLFLSTVIPSAFDNIFAVNTTDWDTGTAQLWVLIPLAVVAAVVILFVPKGDSS